MVRSVIGQHPAMITHCNHLLICKAVHAIGIQLATSFDIQMVESHRQQCDAKLGSRLSSCLHPDCLAIRLCLQSREVTIDVVWALVCDPPLQCLHWQSVS